MAKHNDNLVTIPPLATELITILDKAIPPRCIRKGESLEDAHRYAGKRELVDMLLSRLDFTERKTRKEVINTNNANQ